MAWKQRYCAGKTRHHSGTLYRFAGSSNISTQALGVGAMLSGNGGKPTDMQLDHAQLYAFCYSTRENALAPAPVPIPTGNPNVSSTTTYALNTIGR